MLKLVIFLLAALFFVAKFVFRKQIEEIENDPEYQAGVRKIDESYKLEETIMEEAPWIGTTGLPEEDERELPKYLRRELGELILDDDSLKAAQLRYVGKFQEEGNEVHYWQMPYESDEPVYAYVAVGPDGTTFTSWGDCQPSSDPGLSDAS